MYFLGVYHIFARSLGYPLPLCGSYSTGIQHPPGYHGGKSSCQGHLAAPFLLFSQIRFFHKIFLGDRKPIHYEMIFFRVLRSCFFFGKTNILLYTYLYQMSILDYLMKSHDIPLNLSKSQSTMPRCSMYGIIYNIHHISSCSIAFYSHHVPTVFPIFGRGES